MTRFNVILLLVAMAGSGFLGGAANHLLLEKDDPENAKRLRCLILGMVASFLMPLLLRTISSNLIDKITTIQLGSGIPFDFFVFASICLLAAVFSRPLLETVSKRVLAEIERTKQQSQEAQSQAAIAEEMVSQAEPILRMEMDERSEPQPTSLQVSTLPVEDFPLDRTDRELLMLLTNGPYLYRSSGGIATEAQADQTDVERRLEKMREHALAGKRTTPTRRLWFLTNKGYDLLTAKGLKEGSPQNRLAA
jgi:membrane protein implicated in regulation of membrane protease activity